MARMHDPMRVHWMRLKTRNKNRLLHFLERESTIQSHNSSILEFEGTSITSYLKNVNHKNE
ncbi:hypothetical protein RYX36_003169, partial [Vicia faba]